MPRSKRRCATALHEVLKWTLPSCWSASSCASAGFVRTSAVSDRAAIDRIFIMDASPSSFVQASLAQDIEQGPSWKLQQIRCAEKAGSHQSGHGRLLRPLATIVALEE